MRVAAIDDRSDARLARLFANEKQDEAQTKLADM